MNFIDKFRKIVAKNNSLVCIGLDTDITKIPQHLLKKPRPLFQFNKAIIDATHDLVCAYKPNIAFYEAEGINGLESLKKTINYLQKKFPEIPIILDTKRADIGNTSGMYAKAIFDYWKVDATTVYPFLGYDAVEPFLRYENAYIFFLVHTSNPDAAVLQEVKVDNQPYYLLVAQEIKKWNKPNGGVFVGATYPAQLMKIRNIFPDKIILTAGIGSQGGEIQATIKAGIDKGGSNLICNSSRSIIYASSGKDFAQVARKEATKLKESINKYR